MGPAFRRNCTLTAALWALAAPACVEERAGHEQTLQLQLEGALPKVVESGHLVISAAELLECPGPSARSESVDWGVRLADWLVPTAHAHSDSHALRIGAPRVVALDAAGDSLELGRFYAPDGLYCRVTLEIAPADADAEGVSLDGGVGETLVVTYRDGRPPLRSDGALVVTIDLPQPMEVAGAPQQHVVTLVLSLDAWRAELFESGPQALAALARALGAR